MSEPRRLGDLIAGWPDKAPQTGRELVFTSHEALHETLDPNVVALVTGLRRHIIDAGRSMGQSTQLGGPEAVARALEKGEIRLVAKRWVTFSLDRHKRVTWKPVANDSSRSVNRVDRMVPDAAKLPHLEDQGSYLMFWGGGIDVLDIPDVQTRLLELVANAPMTDIIFRKLVAGQGAMVYSAKMQFGSQGANKLEFTQREFLNHLKEAAGW